MSEDTFCTYMDVQLFPSNAVTQYLGLRSRLAFYPTLYKFIARALWAWIHSCFGVQAKAGPYNWRRLWEICLI